MAREAGVVMEPCRVVEIQGPVEGWWAVVLAGDCGAEVVARFAGYPVTVLLEAWVWVLG